MEKTRRALGYRTVNKIWCSREEDQYPLRGALLLASKACLPRSTRMDGTGLKSDTKGVIGLGRDYLRPVQLGIYGQFPCEVTFYRTPIFHPQVVREKRQRKRSQKCTKETRRQQSGRPG